MGQLGRYIGDALFDHPELTDARDTISLVLSGSRAVNYHVPSSDYDLLGVCDAETYARVCERAGRDPSAKGIHILPDKEEVRRRFGIEVDVAVYEVGRIREAIRVYNDVVLWIWTNAQVILDRENTVAGLKSAIGPYPRETLESKIKEHFLRDFHLSVHALTYRPESQNLFSVVHALAAKVGEYCRLCCLLDGKPFPYEKWLLRACGETHVGERLAPIFRRVLTTLTHLDNDLERSWPSVRQAVDAIDTEACDILEGAMVARGDRPRVDRQLVPSPGRCALWAGWG
jgi:hypothetical protein